MVLRPPSESGRESTFWKITDRSPYALLVGEEDAPLRVFLLHLNETSVWELYRSVNHEPLHRDVSEGFMMHRSAPLTGCLIEKLAVLLAFDVTGHVHVPACQSLAGMAREPEVVAGLIGLSHPGLVLASHLGVSVVTRVRSEKARAQEFGVLLTLRPLQQQQGVINTNTAINEERASVAPPPPPTSTPPTSSASPAVRLLCSRPPPSPAPCSRHLQRSS